ncbi:transposase-like protein [Hirsutella rhossiliensis]
MMRSLSLVSLLRRYDIRYDPKSHRLRCQGHIINLAAKAFLFVTDNEKLKDDERDGHNLHNFVVFVQSSVQRRQKFLAISHNRKLA